MLGDSCGSDAMARIAAFLQWEDLVSITRCSWATRDPETSAFHRAWASRSTLVLPPDSLVSHAILSTISSVNAVTVPHSQWLDEALEDKALTPRLARIQRVAVDPYRFQLDAQGDLDLRTIAHAFPSTTHLRIYHFDTIKDRDALSAFRGLRRLELLPRDVNTWPDSALDVSALEELTWRGWSIHALQSMGSMINLRSLHVRMNRTIGDLSFAMHLSKLTDLSLEGATLTASAVRDLLHIAPRLTHFECGELESVWSGQTTTSSTCADGVDAYALALAFQKLESLIISSGQLQDVSSFSLMTSLRSLRLGSVKVTDITPLTKLVRLEQLHLETACPIAFDLLTNLPHLKSLTYTTFSAAHYRRRERMINLDNLERLSVLTRTIHEGLDLPRFRAPRLRQLELITTRCGDVSDLHLRFPRLRQLSISCRHWNTQPQDSGLPISLAVDVLASVTRLQDLESLRLEWYPHDIDFALFARLQRLRRLVLLKSHIKTLYGIDKLPSLSELQVSQTATAQQDLDLSPLEALPLLHSLDFSDCVISDVTPLTRIASLQVVRLPWTVDCQVLSMAYHANRTRPAGTPSSLDLHEIRQDTGNPLWVNRHYF